MKNALKEKPGLGKPGFSFSASMSNISADNHFTRLPVSTLIQGYQIHTRL